MMERSDGPDLAQESLGRCTAHVLAQNLDRNASLVTQVLREIHNRHAAVAKLLLDLVATSQFRAKTFNDRIHGTL